MKPEYRSQHQLRNEIIKSGAVLLLAVILLISAVFAWFGGDENPTIEPFLIRIKDDNDSFELGSDIVTDKLVVLPCATILGDSTISVNDFSKAIKVMPLEVESPMPNDVSITIETVPGLHFYIDINYDKNNDNALSYAQTITDNFINGQGNDTSIDMQYKLPDDYIEEDNLYRHWVAIVYWADYDHEMDDGSLIGDIINNEGRIELNSTMSFKVIRDDA